MRKLPFITFFAIVVIAAMASISLTNCSISRINSDYGDTVDSSIEDSCEENNILYDPNSDTIDYSLIVRYKNIEVHWDTECSSRHLTDDMDHKEGVLLKRYVDGVLSDSSIIVGPYTGALGDKSNCLVYSGVDTVKIDVRRPMPHIINTRRLGELQGCKNYRISKHHAISDSAYTTDFQLNISVQNSTPNFILQFISALIRDDVAGYFDTWDGDERIVPSISTYHATLSNINSMMSYYYRQFCKLYDTEFDCELSEEDVKKGYWNAGDRYSYQLYVYPVWENNDKSSTTWKFYTYKYMGGAHGGEREYYLTFDNQSGRILGIRDFFRKDVIPQVYDKLAEQLNAHFTSQRNTPYHDMTANLNTSLGVTAMESDILNEEIGGELYPRPAVTSHGIVFSYQTYEKGSNADGILHFIQPFKQDFKLKR